MEPRVPSEDDWVLRFVRRLAAAATWWHDGALQGAQHLPEGPALLVGNHGIFGFESPVFFYLLHRATGRLPVGLADRVLFGRPPLGPIVERIGGVPGTRENARALLGRGHLVVCYPGGASEVFKPPSRRYELQWERTVGFARVAIESCVPVLPFAGLGVDDSYLNLGHLRLARRAMGRYAVPVAVGLGPLPLPAPFRFRVGAPMRPPTRLAHANRFKEEVREAVEALLRVGPASLPDDPVRTASLP